MAEGCAGGHGRGTRAFAWVEVSGTRLIHHTPFRSRSVMVASL